MQKLTYLLNDNYKDVYFANGIRVTSLETIQVEGKQYNVVTRPVNDTENPNHFFVEIDNEDGQKLQINLHDLVPMLDVFAVEYDT